MSEDKGEAGLDELAAAAADLRANARELGAWWQIAECFAALGKKDDAQAAFLSLGEAANELAAVGLSIACGKRALELGAEAKAKALFKNVAAYHCKGSKRVDPAQGGMPPAPPTASADDGEEIPPARAVDAAKDAITAASKAAKARAPKRVPPTPLIRYLDPKDLRSLVELMSLRRYQRGDVVVDVGDEADALFWIARGAAEVSKGDRLLGELTSDAFFGEIALVGASTRTARVACLEESDILSIPASAIGDLAVKAPSLAQVLASHARARLLSNVMRTSELFRRLSNDERRSLLPRFEAVYVDEGEALIEGGALNDALFVVVSGRIEVRNGDSVITELSVGDGFGEMSMLGRKPATFDVVATSSALVLKASRDKFDEIAVAHPELLAEVYRLLVERERENDAIIHDASDLVL